MEMDIRHKGVRKTALPRTGRALDAISGMASNTLKGGSSSFGPLYWELVTTDANGNPLPEGSEYIKTKYTVCSEKDIVALAGSDTPTWLDKIIDNETIKINENGLLYVASGGSSGGGIESIVSSGSGNAVTAMTYNPDTKIITYTKGNTFALSSQIPTNTNQLTNGAGFIRDGNGTFTTLSGSGSASKYLAGNGTFYTISHNEISGLPDYYVTLSTAQTISGAKTFTKDVISNSDVIAYASGTVTPSIPIASSTSYGIVKYDNSTIKVNASGQLYVASGGSGGGSVAWGDITGKPSWIGASKPSYAWSEISSKPSGLVTSVSVSGSGNALGSASFSGGTLYLSYTNISGGGSWTGGTITSTIRKDSTNQGFYLGAVSGGWALGCSTSEAWLQAYGSAQTAFYCGGIKQVYIDKTSWTRSAWIVSSDMREKIRLSDFTDILDKVKGIDVFRYRRKDNDGKIYTGVSAQQLLGLLPDFVSYDKTTERYGVTYDVLGACVAIQGIKELYTKHKELDNYVKCRKHWETTKDYEIYQLLKVVKEQSMRIEDLERRVA